MTYSILHDFYIIADSKTIFDMFLSPVCLNQWWTLKAKGVPRLGEEYQFYFTPEYDWSAIVVQLEEDKLIEFQMTRSNKEWIGTTFGMNLTKEGDSRTLISFFHKGWEENCHEYRISNYCWANLLKLFKELVEYGTSAPYEDRNKSS